MGAPFFAKYARVKNERTVYANVKIGTDDTPQIILGSAIGNPADLSNVDRPTSSLGLDRPWFLPILDNKPINGLEFGFGQFAISTERGRLYVLQGRDSFDFELKDFFFGSSVSGDEALLNVGNDVILGLPSRIETLSGVLEFGDVQADDPSIWIDNLIRDVRSWTIAYDRPRQRIFFFPNNQDSIYVLHKQMLGVRDLQGNPVSPWSRYRTAFPLRSGGGITGSTGGGPGAGTALGSGHTIGFGATVVMPLFNPLTGGEEIFFGDGSGDFFNMEGNSGLDGSPNEIVQIAMTAGGGKSFVGGYDSTFVFGTDGENYERLPASGSGE